VWPPHGRALPLKHAVKRWFAASSCSLGKIALSSTLKMVLCDDPPQGSRILINSGPSYLR
jgi:hypothetical protein